MSEEIKETLDDIKRHLDYVEATKQSSIRDNEMKTMYEYITSLQQKVEQLEKENDDLKNRLDNEVADGNLRLKEVEQLENIRKEAIEWVDNNKETREHYEPYGTPMGNPNYTTTHIFGYYELLDILNKGSDK